MSNDYHIIQWNCNGFSRHLDEIKLLLTKINCLAICIQESKFKSNCYTFLRNFTCYYKNLNNVTTAHGGVCIYLNNMVDAEEIHLNTDLQVVAIKIQFPIKCIICSIYLPGSENISTNALNNIVNQFDLPYILLGDFNAHNSIWGSEKTDSRGKILHKFINNNDLNILNNINCPTHFSLAYRTFSHIDLSLISPEIEHQFEWNVCDDLHNSDHYPILIKYNGITPSFQRRHSWNIRKANWDKFNCNLNKPFDNFNNVDEIERYITNEILNSAQKAVPYKKSDCNRKEVPWWNNTIKLLIKERRKLLKNFKRNMNSENLAKFLRVKSKVRKEIRESRRKSWMEFCESINLRTSSSDVYRKIKSLNGVSNFRQVISIEDNNTLITDKKDIANILAKKFSKNSSSENYTTKFRTFAATKNVSINTSNNGEVYNIKFSLIELKSALGSSKGTSPGPDNIRYEMLQHLNHNSKQYLLNFYNLLWTTNVFPSNWKKALVIPILKPGKDTTNKNNYRPISLTNCLCKVFERMVNKRLVWYLEKNNIININQSGFRQNRGTIDNLAIFHSDIMESFSSKKDLIAVFFDIRKAYDCVWRNLIFEKLNSSGISGNMSAFILNFLKDRTFCCLIGNTYSDSYTLENGVPQGSVLSVNLFLMAIDSVFKNITRDVKSLAYADDLVIYCSGKKKTTITNKIQKTINKLVSWNDISGFQFNEEKTVAITFSRRRNSTDENICLKLADKNIKFVDKYKFLGVIFDKKLSFQHHIEHIKAKANSKLNIIKMLRCSQFGSDQKTLLKILNSIVLPTIDYASIIYSSASESCLKSLNSILNTGIRLSIGAFKTSPANSLQVISYSLPLHLRRLKHLLNYTLKILSLKDHPFHKMITNYPKIAQLNSKSSRNHPLYLRANDELLNITSKYILDTEKIDSVTISKIAPWTFSDVKVNFSLAYCNKNEMTPTEIQKRFLEVVNTKYKEHALYYTDGSVMNERAGLAVIGENMTIYKRIPNYSSIYTCELSAIKICLDAISYNYFGQKILILSDSKSSLMGICDSFSKNNIIQEIRAILSKIANNNIEFMWIPSHLNIRGNDMVDQMAKDALKNDVDSSACFHYGDYRGPIKKYLHDLWNDLWTNENQTKLYIVQDHIPHKYFQPALPKTDLIKLNRLKIGHCLITHKYLIERSSPPQCECGQILSIYHIFNECRKYEDIKIKYKIKDIKCLSNEREFYNIKNFLTEINIYNSI